MTNSPTIIEDLTLVPVPAWWENPWVWVAALVVLALATWAFLHWWRSRPVKVATTPLPPPGPPPHLEALRRLAELRVRVDRVPAYDAAIECSDILRIYVEARFALPIRFQTTREFLDAAQSHSALGNDPQRDLGEFLRLFDAIKFARADAQPAQLRQTLDGAETFIRSCIPETDLANRA